MLCERWWTSLALSLLIYLISYISHCGGGCARAWYRFGGYSMKVLMAQRYNKMLAQMMDSNTGLQVS